MAQTASVPFEICDGHQDLLGVTKIELTPYPAIAGEVLYITIEGQASVDVEEQTLVHMTIREGPLPAPPAEYSLCDSLLDDMKCPVKAGTSLRSQLLYNVTRLAPAGRAQSTVTTLDKSGQELSCLTMDIDVVRNTPAINSWRRSNNMGN